MKLAFLSSSKVLMSRPAIWLPIYRRILIRFLNPFKPNGISHSYQVDQSISVLKGCWVCGVSFFSNFSRIFCEQAVETLIRHRVLRRLIWVFTVCICPTKRMQGDNGLTYYRLHFELVHIWSLSVRFWYLYH